MECPDEITQEADLIDAMCLTWRHDFALPRSTDSLGIEYGMTSQGRDGLRLQMRQIYEHHVKPAIQSAVEAERAANISTLLSFVLSQHSAHGTTENPYVDARKVAAAIRKGA